MSHYYPQNKLYSTIKPSLPVSCFHPNTTQPQHNFKHHSYHNTPQKQPVKIKINHKTTIINNKSNSNHFNKFNDFKIYRLTHDNQQSRTSSFKDNGNKNNTNHIDKIVQQTRNSQQKNKTTFQSRKSQYLQKNPHQPSSTITNFTPNNIRSVTINDKNLRNYSRTSITIQNTRYKSPNDSPIQNKQVLKNKKIQAIYIPRSSSNNSKLNTLIKSIDSQTTSNNSLNKKTNNPFKIYTHTQIIRNLASLRNKKKNINHVINHIKYKQTQQPSKNRSSSNNFINTKKNIHNNKFVNEYPYVTKMLPIKKSQQLQLSQLQSSTHHTPQHSELNKIKMEKIKNLLQNHGYHTHHTPNFQTQPTPQLDPQEHPKTKFQHKFTKNPQNHLPNKTPPQRSFTVTSQSPPTTSPKFNNFLQTYQKSFQNIDNHNFHKILFKASSNKQQQQINNHNFHSNQKQQQQQQYLQSNSPKPQPQKYQLQQLQIFQNLDISLLKTLKLPDGIYYGQLDSSNLKHGKGAIFYSNGKLYQGTFKSDLKDGVGLQIYPDNARYKGQFKQGKKQGKGRFQWSNGQTYDGQWQNNFKHGSGYWQSKALQCSYLGEWKADIIQGLGVLTNKKGERYEGQFKNYNKQGHGIYRFANGDRLVGNFKRNSPNGQCEYFWDNGDYYKGEFLNGYRHGKGVIQYIDGSSFQGEFRNDKKCGFGTEIYHDNVIYLGNFQNDLRHGYGKITYDNIVYYQGYWLNNVAVLFQDNQNNNDDNNNDDNNQIIQDRSQKGQDFLLPNKINNQKINKLKQQQQQKILKSMSNNNKTKKQFIQKISTKNLFLKPSQSHFKRGCVCCLSKYQQS